MARWDELFDDNNQQINEQRKEVCEARIREVQKFFKKHRVRQWNIVSVEFGEQLFKDKNFNYHPLSKQYSIADVQTMRGLNYGSYELSYFHHAVILSTVDTTKLDKVKTLTVIPIQTKFRPNSFVLRAKYNRFVEYDSHLLIDSVTTIGIERIDMQKSLNLGAVRQLAQVNPIDLKELKASLKEMFGL
jgi:hypothetical protein